MSYITPTMAPASRLRLAGLLLLASCVAPRAGKAGPQAPVSAAQVSRSVESISRQVRAAVVQIEVVGWSGVSNNAGTTAELLAEQRGTGSGLIFDSAGFVVTNAHVVANATDIDVIVSRWTDPAGRPARHPVLRRFRAALVGSDAETDLAVLRIEAEDLVALPFGDSESLQQGEIVLAFGSPRGLENSVSMGVVSSTARQISPDHPLVYIQTDASINPGNSGGPLVDTRGRVVGINTFIVSKGGGNEGLAFAVPSNIVRPIADQLQKNGRVRRGVIGVHTQTVDADLAEALSIPSPTGVIVSDVAPGSPAETAGMRVGDLVLAVDGDSVVTGREFAARIYQHTVGDRVTIDVQRAARQVSLEVGVVERVEDPSSLSELVDPERSLVPALGILGIDLERSTAVRLRLRKPNGVLVAAVSRAGPSVKRRFRQGDVIHSINGRVIANLRELRDELGDLDPGAAVAVQVERRGMLTFLWFRLR